jgi:hypothetical protein
LLTAAPLTAMLSQPLEIDGAVGAQLLGRIRELLYVWKAWDPGTAVVPLLAREIAPVREAPVRRARADGHAS